MKRNSFSRFLMGKGLYVALAVCLAGAGTAAWVTVNNRISEPTPFSETPPAEVQPQENINPGNRTCRTEAAAGLQRGIQANRRIILFLQLCFLARGYQRICQHIRTLAGIGRITDYFLHTAAQFRHSGPVQRR